MGDEGSSAAPEAGGGVEGVVVPATGATAVGLSAASKAAGGFTTVAGAVWDTGVAVASRKKRRMRKAPPPITVTARRKTRTTPYLNAGFSSGLTGAGEGATSVATSPSRCK